jgi:hypothetical protein
LRHFGVNIIDRTRLNKGQRFVGRSVGDRKAIVWLYAEQFSGGRVYVESALIV